jgi:capsular polysaccharide biosynthesis protein
VELRRYLAIIRRRLLLIVLTAAVGVGAGYVSTPKTSVYTARARIFVGALDPGSGANRALSNDQITGLEKVVQTYSIMIDSRPIAEDALKLAPGAGRSAVGLVGATKAAPILGTQLLEVSVTDVDPATAQQLANALCDAFVEKIQTYVPGTESSPGQPPRLPANVFEHASLPGAPQANDIARRLILGGLFGAIAAAAAALVLEYLDITIKTVADAERRLELPVLGVIPMERQQPFTSSRAASAVHGN